VKILAFDTATAATAVAVLDTVTGACTADRDDPPPGRRPRHTTALMQMIVTQLRASETYWSELDRIAVGVGPGTFTGLRIGVATAHALSRARDIPLVGVSTLHSLALGAIGPAPEPAGAEAETEAEAIMAVIDARRGEVFAAGWAARDVSQPHAAPLLAPRALSPEALADERRDGGRAWLAVGDGAIAFREALERSGARIPDEDSDRNRIDAVVHCRLAVGLRPEAPEGVLPEYLRLPDAEISLRASRQR
jgi:tRNA threonylcarbamoyladenosine biosynthesis protein TsaB